MSRDENPHREKVIDSPSFEGFFAQLDCRLTYGNNWELNTGNTRKESIVSCSKREQNRNDERYGQLLQLLEFILIMNHAEVHRNKLIMTISGHRSEDVLEIASAALRVNI